MKPQASAPPDSFDEPLTGVEEAEERSEDDLWFLPGPNEDEPDNLPPGPRAEPRETAILDDWRKAEVVISTVQTLASNNKYREYFSPTDFDLIISDEAHRSTSGCGGGLRAGATGSP